MSVPSPAEAFRIQARGCAATGSRVYAHLLERAADDIDRGGAFAAIVADHRGHPVLDALALRVLGAVHEAVLAGRAPGLAAFYPTAGGRWEPEGAWRALVAFAEAECEWLRRIAASGSVQTNEVQRSAVLLPGFLRVAARTGLPLRVREIGSSAGLNLAFDRYRYRLGSHAWGPADSPLVLEADWEGPAPDLDAPLRVADRRGCDLAPVDLADPAARRRLEAFVWPDQCERLARLRAAAAVASSDPPRIDREPAGSWVAREVAPHDRHATVCVHSVMWSYVPAPERARITAAIEAAGAAARPDAPVAWLRMEGASLEETELRLRLWPGGDDALLARAHYHGVRIRWLAPPA